MGKAIPRAVELGLARRNLVALEPDVVLADWHQADMCPASMSAFGSKADIPLCLQMSAYDPKRKFQSR